MIRQVFLKKDFDDFSAVKAIREIYNKSDREYVELRNSTRQYWIEIFYAKSNYLDFYEKILS